MSKNIKAKTNLDHKSKTTKKLTAPRRVKPGTVGRHALSVARMKNELAVLQKTPPSQTAAWFGGKPDVKTNNFDQQMQSLATQVSLLRTAARNAIGGHHVKTFVVYTATVAASGAGAANASNFAVLPSNSAEWTAYGNLYDEARINSLHIKYIAGASVLPATQPNTSGVLYAIGYDPDYNTTPSNVADVLESDDSQVKYLSCNNPATTSSTDLHQLNVRIPHRDVMNSDMKTDPNFPGSWMDLADPSDSVGFIRYYISATGSTGVTGMLLIIRLECEFRIRT